MWERFRTGTGGAPGDSNSRRQQHQHQQQQRLPPSSADINNTNNFTTTSAFANSNPHYSNSNSSNSWQPRSSVIAQRQRQQQPQHQRLNQQQLRSASADNYSGSGSAGGYGGYQYSIKGGHPPPRPLRDLCVASSFPSSAQVSETPAYPPTCDSSEVPPPVQPPARQQTFPQQPQRQLHPPSAHARHESRDSISGRPTSSVYSQPSPLHTTFAPQRDRPNASRPQPDGIDDVSPPSSPELLSPGNVYV